MLCLHNCDNPVCSTKLYMQIWQHDWTTVHFLPLYLYNFLSETLTRRWPLLPLVRLPARITEKSRAWPPSHPPLEMIKSTTDMLILRRSLFRIAQQRLPQFLHFKSEIRLPWGVAMKTVRDSGRNVPFYFHVQQTTPVYISHLCCLYCSSSPLSQNWSVCWKAFRELVVIV